METLGDRIKRLRRADKKTQQDLADALTASGLNTSRGTVVRWETNKQEPTVAPIMAMSKIFGISAEYLVYGLTTENLIPKPDEKKIIEAIRLNPYLATIIDCTKDFTPDQLAIACRVVCNMFNGKTKHA